MCRLFAHMQADVHVHNNSFRLFPFVNSGGCKWKSWQVFDLISTGGPQKCEFEAAFLLNVRLFGLFPPDSAFLPDWRGFGLFF